MDIEDDLVFVRRFKNGDRRAFDFLVKKYSKRVYNTVLRIVKSVPEAEDLTQEAFLKAYRALPRFKEKSSFYTWVYRIAVNGAINHLKKKKRSLTILDADIKSDEGNIKKEIVDLKFEPGKKIQDFEMMKVIEKAISGLSDANRVVFVMRELNGMPYSDISEALGISQSAVRLRLHRAKKDLQEVLRGYVMKTD